MRTSTQPPFRRVPSSLNLRLPFLSISSADLEPCRLPIATVPQLHRAATVLSLGDGALEVAIVERVILDLDCKAFVLRIERRPASDGPGLEHAIELQPQIVVQPAARRASGSRIADDQRARPRAVHLARWSC